MSKKTKIIIVVSLGLALVLAGILGGYSFSWRQERIKCYNLIQERSKDACESLRTLEDNAKSCLANNDLNCIDLLNYKLFFNLLVKKEKNEVTEKICQQIFLTPKGDVPASVFKNPATFCDDFSQTLIDRNSQNCDALFEDEFSRNYCRFMITADRQYCQGDSRKCYDREILFRSFLDDKFDSCDNILDVNVKTACVFFRESKDKDLFSCNGIYSNLDDFLKNGLDKTYCKNLN